VALGITSKLQLKPISVERLGAVGSDRHRVIVGGGVCHLWVIFMTVIDSIDEI
jgi:hypothetical protein